MNKKFLILICLILFFVSIAGVSATQDLNQTTDNGANDLVSSEDKEILSMSDEVISEADNGTFTALQKKIDQYDYITIALENDYLNDGDESQIVIEKGLIVIDGKNHTIDANGVSRIFYNLNSYLILKNINFINGNAFDGDGGAIYSSDAHISLINCSFVNNSAAGRGGAVYSSGYYSTLEIDSCIFVDNSAGVDAGAIYSDIIEGDISTSTFKNNSPNNVNRLKTSIYLPTNVFYANDNVKVKISSSSGKITVKINGKTSKININDNVATFKLSDLKSGEYDLYLEFEGNEVYAPANITEKIRIVDSSYRTFTDLQNLIDEAESGSTIQLENNFIYGLNIEDEPIEIDKSLSIYGNGHTIDGNNKVRIFYISYDDVYLENINFVNGNSYYGGGAIRNWYGCLELSNCNFVNNSADDYGGAIYTNDEIDLDHCSFINNSAGNDGGAIYYDTDFRADISSSTFKNNSPNDINKIITSISINNNVFVVDDDVVVTLLSNGNRVNVNGKITVKINGKTTKVNLNDGVATFNLNGLKMDEYDLYLEFGGNDVYAASNTTEKIKIFDSSCGSFTDLQNLIDNAERDSTIVLNKDFIYGLNSDDETIEIRKSITIDGNGHTIDGNNKVRLFYIYSYSSSEIYLENINFVNGNYYGGGAIYSYSTLTIDNCSFVNNSADDYGGAIYSSYSTLTIDNSSFVNNSAEYGGAVYVYGSGSTINIDDCSFVNNSADDYGGAIYVSDDVDLSVGACSFVNNSAEYGGAIYIYDDVVLSVDGCSFMDNSALYDGGAIYSKFNIRDNVTGTTFKNNSPNDINKIKTSISINKKAFYVNEVVNVTIYANGEILNVNGKITVKINGKTTKVNLNNGFATFNLNDLKIGEYDLYIKFDGNVAYNASNATIKIRIVDSSYGSFTDLQKLIDEAEENSTIKLKNNFIYGLNAYDETIEIEKSLTIDGNGYTVDGNNEVEIFSIYGSENNVTLKNINFVNGNSHYNGGAVYSRSSKLNVLNCKFINNSAVHDGGAIYSVSSLDIIDNCSFVNNFAEYGGGALYLTFRSSITSHASYALISNSIFESNSAWNYGGSIYSERQIDFDNCKFINNHANEGGAIYTYNGYLDKNALTITIPGYSSTTYYSDYPQQFGLSISGNSVFKDNFAEYGGAISIDYKSNYIRGYNGWYNEYGILILNKGVVFENNSADYGGALRLEYVDAKINGAEFRNNEAYYSETIYNTGNSTVNIINSVFDSDSGNEPFIRYYGNSTLFLNNNKMSNNYSYDVYYASIAPLAFKTWLIFENYTVSRNSYVNLGELQDRNGNIIRIPEINVILTKVDDSKVTNTVTLKYDENAGGYRYYCALDGGVYKVTGSISSNITTNYDVVSGMLTVNDIKLEVPDVTKNYGGSEKLMITLTNANEPIANSKVNIKLGNDNFNATTNSLGKASVPINLDVGNYVATVSYGDVSTKANIVVNQASTKTDLSFDQNSYNSVTLTAAVSPSTATGKVTFNVNGENYSRDIKNSKATLTLKDLPAKSYTVKATYGGNANHNSSVSNNVKFTVDEHHVNIVAPDVTMDYGGSGKLVITLTNQDSEAVSGAKIKISLGDKNLTKTTDSKGKVSLDIDLDSGSYEAVIVFEGNDEYKEVTTTALVTVNQVSTKTSLSYVKNTYNSVTLTAAVSPSTATGKVTFNVNGKNYSRDIKNSKATLTLKDLTTESYTVKATYGGDVNHKSSVSRNVEFSVDEYYVNIVASDVTMDYGGSEKLVITVTNQDSEAVSGAKIKISLGDKNLTKTTDSKGKVSLDIDLDSGSYEAVIVFEGDDKYKPVTTTAKVTVNKLNSKTTVSYVNNAYGNVTLTALVEPSDISGNVVFNVNGKNYNAKVTNGKATYDLNNLAPGSYNVKATYGGDTNHKSSSNSISFNIREDALFISAPSLTKYYKGPERFVVTVMEKNVPLVGKNVTINLNGRPYIRTTDDNGQASMAINLNSGVYDVTAEYDGIKVDSKITVKSTVSGNNVTKIFRNGTQYYATFVDTKGNLMKNTDVKFNINGVFYTRTTDENGKARMNINLPPGTYILTAENPNSTEKYTNVIKVLPSIVENYDLTKYYRNASKYTLRVLGDDGRPVGEGVTVKLNINGVFYERKTNASGYMSMNINLPPGTYTVTAEYNGLRASNTIKVLSVLQTKDLSMKYRDGSKFEAKILDGQGKPYAGQTVSFNINGVFYQRTTGADGIARLSINLMAGQYIITSMFNGLNAANKVTISG